MSFLTKIFSKKDKREEEDEKDQRLIQERTKYLESIGRTNDIQKHERFVKDWQYFITRFQDIGSSKGDAVAEYMKEELAITKLQRCNKIVNEFGQAIMEANEHNKRLVANLNGEAIAQAVKEGRADYYRLLLLNKFDINFLPYNKEIIRDAIEFLLQASPDDALLVRGLIYLDDFIDLPL